MNLDLATTNITSLDSSTRQYMSNRIKKGSVVILQEKGSLFLNDACFVGTSYSCCGVLSATTVVGVELVEGEG